jgi:HPt (histidine-containing phosphotransfer) domain-containing protein
MMGARRRKSTRLQPAPVDLSVIEELADGDIAAMAELVAMFKRHTIEAIAQARMAVAAGQPQEVVRTAHTCIGFTASLGLITMVPILREIEHAARQDPPPTAWAEELTQLLAKWQQDFERICEVLRSRTDRSDRSGPP